MKPLVVIFCVLAAIAQARSQSQGVSSQATLFARYEVGASGFKTIEDVFNLSLTEAPAREQIALRVCSQEPFLTALGMAAANPFELVKELEGIGYSADRIHLLLSRDCLSTKYPALPATEIWGLGKGSPLPPNDVNMNAGSVRLTSYYESGVNPTRYKNATSRLITELERKPKAIGLVLGYFLTKPNAALLRRLNTVKKLLAGSRIPQQRYTVRLKPWNKGSTAELFVALKYPSFLLLEEISKPASTAKDSFSNLR